MVQNDMTLNHKYNLFWHSVCLFVCVWLFVYLFAAYDLWYKLRCQQDKEGKPVQWPPVLYLQKDGNCCWKTWPAKKEKRTPNNSGHSGGSKITKAPEEESVSPPILWGLQGGECWRHWSHRTWCVSSSSSSSSKASAAASSSASVSASASAWVLNLATVSDSGGYTLRAARQHYCLAGNNSRVCG